jgi:4-hydroxy-tetrahydrodipicolinate synthase
VISGAYVPMLTAFDQEGHLDTGAYAAFAQWLAGRGVDGFVPFGTTGEGASLSLRERLAALDKLAAAVPGTPVVPAVMESSLDTVLEFVAAVNDIPVAGIMVLPPYYFRPLLADQLRRFIEPVVAASRPPVMLYHIPKFGPPVPVEALPGLGVWGVKDSGGDQAYTKSVLEIGGSVMVGTERLVIEAIGFGASGAIAGLANLLPEHLAAACSAARAGDLERATAILAPALSFQERLNAECRVSPVEWISVGKSLATLRSGVPLGNVRPPVQVAPDEAARALKPQLEAVLAELDQVR